MSHLVDLSESITEQLAPLDAPVILGQLPQRGTAIAVTFYDVEPPEGTTDTVQGVQLMIRDAERNDSRATLRLSDEAFLILHGQSLTEWGDIPIHHVWRNSSADMGRDEDGAYLRSDNYYVRLSRTGPHLSDT